MLPESSVSETDLARMRPDILRIVGLPPTPTQAQIEHAIANKNQYTVQVVEVGYCSDYNWRQKVAEKTEQHKLLLAALQQAGWTVDGTAHVVVVGAKGAVYLSGQAGVATAGADGAASKQAAGRDQPAGS